MSTMKDGADLEQPGGTPESSQREYPHGPIPSAHAIVLRNDRVLLVKRAHDPGKGRWSLPGGMIRLGETIYEAVQREVREECSMEIEPVRILDVFDSILKDEQGRIRFHYLVVYLLARYLTGEAQAGSDASEVRWATREELNALDMHPRVRETVHATWLS
ncbi:MAG TPA: NUDIX hydrolase [Anaerolineae bacterium]|nr:NUDIX hydrolase [Anaerolineae bacterium]